MEYMTDKELMYFFINWLLINSEFTIEDIRRIIRTIKQNDLSI